MNRLSITLAAVLAVSALAPAQERREENTFEGQFLSIVKKSKPDSSVDLERVVVRSLGGKVFLVGIGTDTPGNWQKGKVVWVALDDVSEVTAFATLDELRKAAAAEGEPKKDGQ